MVKIRNWDVEHEEWIKRTPQQRSRIMNEIRKERQAETPPAKPRDAVVKKIRQKGVKKDPWRDRE